MLKFHLAFFNLNLWSGKEMWTFAYWRIKHLVVGVAVVQTHVVNVVILAVIAFLAFLFHPVVILHDTVAITILSHLNQHDNANLTPHTHTRCQHHLDDD